MSHVIAHTLRTPRTRRARGTQQHTTTPPPPNLLGSRLLKHQQHVCLRIGHDEWSRQDMIDHLRCGNFVAAAALSKALKRLRVTSIHDAERLDAVDLFSIKGIGETAVYVLMCALEAAGYDPLNWLGFNRRPRTIGTMIRLARGQQPRRRA